MKKRGIIRIVSISSFIIFVFVVMFGATKTLKKKNTNENKVQFTQVNLTTTLSNKKLGWGIKREDNNKQPAIGTTYTSVLDKYEGMYLGNIEKSYVYLTFDEGYEAGYTPQLLETLKQNDVKATFFLTAHFLNTQENLVRQMIEEGHIVGNHTVNHKSMPDLTDEKVESEIMTFHKAMYEKIGYEMKYLRPPMGEFSERTVAISNNLGYKTVMWSFAYDDWDENNQKGEEYAKTKILGNIHNGAIILLHGNSKDNVTVLDYCIKEIKNMGYEFKTLDEFVR